jgi:hypothetical protein
LNSLPVLKQGTRWALRRLWAMNLQEARETWHTHTLLFF